MESFPAADSATALRGENGHRAMGRPHIWQGAYAALLPVAVLCDRAWRRERIAVSLQLSSPDDGGRRDSAILSDRRFLQEHDFLPPLPPPPTPPATTEVSRALQSAHDHHLGSPAQLPAGNITPPPANRQQDSPAPARTPPTPGRRRRRYTMTRRKRRCDFLYCY